MKQTLLNSLQAVAVAAAVSGTLLVTGCGSSTGKGFAPGAQGAGAVLQSLEYGRLVDIYSYRKTSPLAHHNRRDTLYRMPVLVARNVVVDSSIQSEPLFDAVGEENRSANYRFLPFNVDAGHEELLILWDDTDANERPQFQSALNRARGGLIEVPASYRGQARTIPLVPRNAALKLTFDRNLNLSNEFFVANPGAVQLLEFRGDPNTTPPQQAFRPVSHRVISQGNVLILDPSLIGAETSGANTTGMPPSPANAVIPTANIRIAMPVNGRVSRQMRILPDPVPQLNGVDSNGDPSVIRDFRSGNARDGSAGALVDVEPPQVVADIPMGIIDIKVDDPTNPMSGGVLTVLKRFAKVAVRGRIPFVDGGLVSAGGLPGGPNAAPIANPLRSGDFIEQDVLAPSGELVHVRAEIITNEDVGNVLSGPLVLGLTAANDDGGDAPLARVRVASLSAGVDSRGNRVSFKSNALPSGEDCTVRVHYNHHVPYVATSDEVSDARRMQEFLVFDPPVPFTQPNGVVIPRGQQVNPLLAGVSLRFSEPLDLSVAESHDNLFLSTSEFPHDPPNVIADDLLQEPKPAALSIIGTRLVDEEGNGTLLRLVPPMGLYHEGPNGANPGNAETYWMHALAGDDGPERIQNGLFSLKDLSGNALDINDRRLSVDRTFSLSFKLKASAPDNLVASRVLRFASVDEDGTPDGSVDYFGQFGGPVGQLAGAPTQRNRLISDGQTMGTILRYDKGECWDWCPAWAGALAQPPPTQVLPTAPPGVLYQCPSAAPPTHSQLTPPAVFTPPPPPTPFGGDVNPFNPRGARLQMTYREDDFGLSYTDANALNLDLEALLWAIWNNDPVQFDVFDRVSIAAAHSDWRPDLLYFLNLDPNPDRSMANPSTCNIDCSSLTSGLRGAFDSNMLEGTRFEPLVQQKVYQINPNAAWRSPSQTTFVPYATFQKSYTWRDSRLLTWDMNAGRAVGLGGAKDPDGPANSRDRTANVSSPWIADPPDASWPAGARPTEPPSPFSSPAQCTDPTVGFTGTYWTMSAGDFRGERTRDLDPIAMPLLLDFKVWPDNPQNGVANGANRLHVGYIGTCWSPAGPGGYFNAAGAFVCGGVDWPTARVYSFGGIDQNGSELFVDPSSAFTASGGWIFDAGLGDLNGRYQTTPHNVTGVSGDGHVPWAAADFVRKVSLVTFGFFDTQLPNQHNFNPALIQTKWPGLNNKPGFPDFKSLSSRRTLNLGVQDLLMVMDPPLSQQPGGTSVTLELRGADSFDRSSGPTPGNYIYDKVTNDRFDQRGNLLNPSYACEAYRYAMPNAPAGGNTARVVASRLTPYVIEKDLDKIRNPPGNSTAPLPRFLNLRITFVNDTASNPPVSPSLRSVAIVYRMVAQ